MDEHAPEWLKRLDDKVWGDVTEGFLDALIEAMHFAVLLFPGFRRNLKGFRGKYLFTTLSGSVTETIGFEDGSMWHGREGCDDWDVRVSFADSAALRAFLFSKDQDILQAMLANQVEVTGNVNYIYKFGFMARELTTGRLS
jgi:hypothetical protein